MATCDVTFQVFSSHCFRCFSCFMCLFQLFHSDVSKVDLGIAHVARLHTCFSMFQVFHLFQTYVASGCFKSRSWCYTCCNGCIRMFYAHVSSVSSVFRFMLQMFHLDVSKYIECCMPPFAFCCRCATMVLNTVTDWERDGVRGMRCMIGTWEDKCGPRAGTI
jgi:hypothetical protein